jgi:protease I
MAPKALHGKTVALLVADGFEQVELTSPRRALEEAGARTVIVSPKAGTVRGWNHFEKADSFDVDTTTRDARADDFDALVLPGGVANPDQLRTDKHALRFVREFFDQKKPVAAICHAPWTLIDAGAARGRRLTSYPSLRSDLINAGAQWIDEECVVDNGLVTSRTPDDLPVFNERLIEVFGRSSGGRESDTGRSDSPG